MLVKKPLNWFLTDEGRKFSLSLLTTTGLTLGAVNFLPNTILLRKYKDWILYSRNSKSIELPKELHDRFHKCLDILQFTEFYKKIVKPFCATDLDLFHAGCLSFKSGAVVILPFSFTFKSLEDVKRFKLKVENKAVDLTSETGERLGKALILSEKAQEFAICREILMVDNNKIILESTNPIVCLISSYYLAQFLNRKYNYYAAPARIRVILYSLISTLMLGLYLFMKDLTQVHYEIEADKQLAELGPDYIRSGIEFYEKLLERNKALRELLGTDGKSKYTDNGNENYGFRNPGVQLTHRKEYFEYVLNNIEG